MKVEVSVTFYFLLNETGNKIIGEYNSAFGHSTHLMLNDVKQKDYGCEILYNTIPQKLDEIELSIPSGKFVGTVQYTTESHSGYFEVTALGTWTGKWDGLCGGKSCYGTFKNYIAPSTLVESSWGNMTIEAYKAIRSLRYLDGEQFAEVLRVVSDVRLADDLPHIWYMR